MLYTTLKWTNKDVQCVQCVQCVQWWIISVYVEFNSWLRARIFLIFATFRIFDTSDVIVFVRRKSLVLAL